MRDLKRKEVSMEHTQCNNYSCYHIHFTMDKCNYCECNSCNCKKCNDLFFSTTADND